MSDLYMTVLSRLGVPDSVAKFRQTDFAGLTSVWRAPGAKYSYPPALIPLVSDQSGPCYYGYWKHWFVEREPTFVQMSINPDHAAFEIARTPTQFVVRFVLELVEITQGGSEKLRRFAESQGIVDYEGLVAHWQSSGYTEGSLSMLPAFSTKMPRGPKLPGPVGYDGSFPSWDFADKRPWWLTSCSMEIDATVMDRWPSNIPAPDYLTEANGFDLFEAYLEARDLRSAWLSLNSAGWEVAEAQDAIEMLKAAAADPAFDLLADAWVEAADRFRRGY